MLDNSPLPRCIFPVPSAAGPEGTLVANGPEGGGLFVSLNFQTIYFFSFKQTSYFSRLIYGILTSNPNSSLLLAEIYLNQLWIKILSNAFSKLLQIYIVVHRYSCLFVILQHSIEREGTIIQNITRIDKFVECSHYYVVYWRININSNKSTLLYLSP